MKALFFNGSPRKTGNTAQLLKRAMDGAREAGAEVELVNLYSLVPSYTRYSYGNDYVWIKTAKRLGI